MKRIPMEKPMKQTLSNGLVVTQIRVDDAHMVHINGEQTVMPMREFHALGGIVALFHGMADWVRPGKYDIGRFHYFEQGEGMVHCGHRTMHRA